MKLNLAKVKHNVLPFVMKFLYGKANLLNGVIKLPDLIHEKAFLSKILGGKWKFTYMQTKSKFMNTM